jgi:hypothetical protein
MGVSSKWVDIEGGRPAGVTGLYESGAVVNKTQMEVNDDEEEEEEEG